jgi:hypothetical protein
MPLNTAGLQSDLEALFAAPPPTAAECAQAWSDAFAAYVAGVVPPALPAAVSAAADAMAAQLTAAFQGPAAPADFDVACTAFAAAVALGMAPTFTGAPPPAPLLIVSLLGSPQPTHAAAAAAFAALIDTWMRTGSAVLVAPPFTVIPAWS